MKKLKLISIEIDGAVLHEFKSVHFVAQFTW